MATMEQNMQTLPLEMVSGRHSVSMLHCQAISPANVASIRARLATLSCAVINAKLILSAELVFVAATKAFYAFQSGGMKTKSLYTELLYRLSASTNLTESLKTFGLTDDCTAALFVRFDADPAEFQRDLSQVLSENGAAAAMTAVAVPLEELPRHCDIDAICKIYKITRTACNGAAAQEEGGCVARSGVKDQTLMETTAPGKGASSLEKADQSAKEAIRPQPSQMHQRLLVECINCIALKGI